VDCQVQRLSGGLSSPAEVNPDLPRLAAGLELAGVEVHNGLLTLPRAGISIHIETSYLRDAFTVVVHDPDAPPSRTRAGVADHMGVEAGIPVWVTHMRSGNRWLGSPASIRFMGEDYLIAVGRLMVHVDRAFYPGTGGIVFASLNERFGELIGRFRRRGRHRRRGGARGGRRRGRWDVGDYLHAARVSFHLHQPSDDPGLLTLHAAHLPPIAGSVLAHDLQASVLRYLTQTRVSGARPLAHVHLVLLHDGHRLRRGGRRWRHRCGRWRDRRGRRWHRRRRRWDWRRGRRDFRRRRVQRRGGEGRFRRVGVGTGVGARAMISVSAQARLLTSTRLAMIKRAKLRLDMNYFLRCMDLT